MKSRTQLYDLVQKASEDRKAYFAELFQEIPELIVRGMTYKEIGKNEILIEAGMPCEMVYLILTGNVEGLQYQSKGDVYYFMDFSQMYLVGDFEVFSNLSEYMNTICTIDACKVLAIPSASYLKWMKQDNHALFLRMQKIMTTLSAERTRDREYIFMNCKQRLMRYLCASYEATTKEASELLKILQTQTQLAQRIGFHMRSVQRSIVALEKEGLLTLQGGKIQLTAQQYLRLKQRVEEPDVERGV
jgi:CRP-like cAMP-binding protein